MADIRSKISDISKGKRIHAVVIEIFNGYATVSAGGRLYKGLNVIGGPVVVDQKVFIDFSSGTPIVHAYSAAKVKNSTSTTRTITTRILADAEVVDPTTGLNEGAHTHSESQITDIDHNARKIQGIPIDSFTVLNNGESLRYNQANTKFVLRSEFTENQSANCNGSNVNFSTIHSYVIGSLRVSLNGLFLHSGIGNDFIEDGIGIAFEMLDIPIVGDTLLLTYTK